MEVVYENATKVDKRITYTTCHSKGTCQRVIKAGGTFKVPFHSQFKLISTETVV